MDKLYEFDIVIHPADQGGGYTIFPYDARVVFSKGSIARLDGRVLPDKVFE